MSNIKLTEEELLKDEAIIDAKTEEINANSAKKPKKPKVPKKPLTPRDPNLPPRSVPHTELSIQP
jgi:hypothetical protein